MQKYMHVFWLLLMFGSVSYADARETLFNVFSLQAQKEAEVINDEMVVVMSVERENTNPAVLAKFVNEDMGWALQQVKKNSALSVRTLAYSTYPVYEKRAVARWRAQQQLEIKSTDIPAVNKMIGVLQNKLQVKQMQFKPTAATRSKIEDELVSKALQAFKARANLVRKAMSAKTYKIVSADINTSGQYRPVSFSRHKERALLSSADVAPAVEAGTSKITVSVNGSIQLQ